jgi:hypothetical protein
MKIFLSIYVLFLAATSMAQSKNELIEKSMMDSIIQFEGEGALLKGNCLFVKFSGDAQLFFNQLAFFHAQDNDQLARTKNTLSIYETSKPYWVFGPYSVFAEFFEKEGYQLIEISFKAYSNPDNYKIVSAIKPYQQIINQLLNK